MAYEQGTPFQHCAATVMHSKPWSKMRNRTAAIAGRGASNKSSISQAKKLRSTPLAKKETLKDVAGQLRKASKMHLGQAKIVERHIEEMKKGSPATKKTKGGGTTKVCLPLAKIRSMSKEERQKVINAKRAAGRAGKYRRSSKSNVSGTSSGGSLKTWLEQDWRQVANPSKKCGEK